jgi:hypothetical protein
VTAAVRRDPLHARSLSPEEAGRDLAASPAAYAFRITFTLEIDEVMGMVLMLRAPSFASW